MSLQMVTVTGTLKHLDGTPQVGRVEFALPYTLVDTAGHVLWSDSSVPAELDNGAFTVDLPATDSAGVSPTNWTYTVTIAADGNSDAPFQCLLPSTPSTVHLDQLVRVDVPPTVGVWVPVGTLGVTVATLGDDGLVPVDQLPAGSGGGVATVGAGDSTVTIGGTTTDPTVRVASSVTASITAAGSAAAAAQSTANGAATTAAAAYVKPGLGIPKADLVAAVQTSLNLADSALQSAPVTSVATRTGAVTLTKSDVGLSSVDNTSDTGKPVSTAQATAIAAKYTLPGGGVPKTDLAASVQTSLGLADTALQAAPSDRQLALLGAHSTNVPLFACRQKSTINNEAWFGKLIVRAGSPLAKAITHRSAAVATHNTTGLNGFAIWSGSGSSLLWQSASDDAMWEPTGQIFKAITGIATPTTDTTFWIAASARGYSAAPEFAFVDVSDVGILGDFYARYKGGGYTTWPASFDPAVDLTTGSGYVLPLMIG